MSTLPSTQVIQTAGGPLVVPVPHAWSVSIVPPSPIKLGEIILEGPCDPALTKVRGMKTERAQVTLRFDHTGTISDKCRVRREGQKMHWVVMPAPVYGKHVEKHGTTGVASVVGWVLRALMQNGRGL